MDLSKHIACHDCDLLIQIPDNLAVHQKICCPRCASEQFEVRKDPVDRTIALALTSSILLVLALSFPFLSISSTGLENTISLLQSPIALYRENYAMIGLIVLACVVILPAVYLFSLLALLFPIHLLNQDHGSTFYAKIVSSLEPWIMADVFIIGVLVALIKLLDTAEILLGVAFWAYIAFTISFLVLSNTVSKRQLWYWVVNGK